MLTMLTSAEARNANGSGTGSESGNGSESGKGRSASGNERRRGRESGRGRGKIDVALPGTGWLQRSDSRFVSYGMCLLQGGA